MVDNSDTLSDADDCVANELRVTIYQKLWLRLNASKLTLLQHVAYSLY